MTVGMNNQVQVALSQQTAPPAQDHQALLPLGEGHVPYPFGSLHHAGSFYLCPGRMSGEDQIYLVPGFNPTTQQQVLRSVWRPRTGTFKTVLDTIPQAVPDHLKLPRWMLYCSEEIVDIDGRLLYFASKEDLRCYINHHHTSHLSSPTFIQSNNNSSGTAVSFLGERNHENSSWIGAASEFLPTPLNQATPVRSPYSCPLAGLGFKLAVKTVNMVCIFPTISITRTPLFPPMLHQWLLAARSGRIFIRLWVYVKEAVFLLHSLFP
jgi:hypothetical protein